MRNKPIYVETEIAADLEELWHHTQSPELHQQWDLRFSEIAYLPKSDDEDLPQRFLYRTRIGFGMAVSGTGETKSIFHKRSGERTSTLRFGSGQRVSLIKEGSGFWKYRPQGDGVVFLTQYDYETRWGAAGQCFDRIVFRPLFGYATAWSFDALRIWLEERIPPSVSIQRAILHYVSLTLLVVLWLYEGIVPKLLYPEQGEMAMLEQLGWFAGLERIVLQLLGAGEIVIALLTIKWHRKPSLFVWQSVLLLLLPLGAMIGNPSMIQSPFNPLTLSVPMIALAFITALTVRQLPQASRCLRKPNERSV
ncbi:DoxX-like family protein [Paenibacillus radicis (ex Gao et al. 2016)]|uniref:Membrane protein n=1 Tax=Paenibacillus radicis (ex Gao et al. 2016) TaxID=1737354 RepID=A0A917M1P2_9BACL|nr:DoxX-like family protein [Paenibacillus radicis (ex Gao et al. 2016)]GGG71000.1 membrane protein [Paenibacillus radicis (ex Gao et al. 2016)]